MRREVRIEQPDLVDSLKRFGPFDLVDETFEVDDLVAKRSFASECEVNPGPRAFALVSSCPATSVPTPGIASNRGAAALTNTRRSLSASVISSIRCWWPRARRRSAVLVAC
jgi:hypothetical protein